ncbi:pilus assembly protein TadG-related protein [Streptomyces sp. NPDC057271]|uniref:pilus assembly protein TadG-related protein n=1 Tax=unclassified Streptomyces TaxID=2593676 RepID=UPI003628ED5C
MGRQKDSGQAFPVYIAVMAGLLFLAFAYFAVGQAAAHRNGAQTAADAAALAAAQDARDQLRDGWLAVILHPTQWDDFLSGGAYDEYAACQRAASFAAKNGAELPDGGCDPLPLGFRVEVRSLDSIGRSVVPGTENQHATATATAVLEPLCAFEAPEPTEDPEPTEEPVPEPEPDPSPTPTEPSPILGLTCDGVPWTIDPDRPELPSAADLFTVRLTD